MRRFAGLWNCCFVVTLFLAGVAASAQTSGRITINVEPKEAYIERRGTEQRINFDLLIHNPDTLPLRINKIQVSAYTAEGSLAFRPEAGELYVLAKSEGRRAKERAMRKQLHFHPLADLLPRQVQPLLLILADLAARWKSCSLFRCSMFGYPRQATAAGILGREISREGETRNHIVGQPLQRIGR
jgi:hypothetical protein